MSFGFCLISDKKIEGDDSVRTVECLRGRLLAERQASRTAKDDLEKLGRKVHMPMHFFYIILIF